MNPDKSGGGNADGILADVMKVEHDPHPFVGKGDVNRFYGILLECYEAQLAWREKNGVTETDRAFNSAMGLRHSILSYLRDS